MYKHTVNYVDFNGNERKEDLYFHLTSVEVLRIEAEVGKDLQDHIKELVDNQDLNSLLAFLEKMLLNSYGKKTSDGRAFHKDKRIRDEFEYSQAYAEVFEDLMNDPELAKKFGENLSAKNKKSKNQFDPKVYVNNKEEE